MIQPSEVTGVFAAIVAADDYGIRQVKQPISTIFDIGANVGMFSLAARVLFPLADIVAVEPEPSNFAALQSHSRLWPRMTCRQAALGRDGPLYHRMGAGPSHSHHGFMTPSPMYPAGLIAELYEPCPEIPLVMLDDLAEEHGTKDLLVKIDTEGAEDSLVDDKPSAAVLVGAQYICMELHFYSPESVLQRSSRKRLTDWVHGFSATHDITTNFTQNGGTVWMRRVQA